MSLNLAVGQENGGLADFRIAIDLTLAMFSSYVISRYRNTRRS